MKTVNDKSVQNLYRKKIYAIFNKLSTDDLIVLYKILSSLDIQCISLSFSIEILEERKSLPIKKKNHT